MKHPIKDTPVLRMHKVFPRPHFLNRCFCNPASAMSILFAPAITACWAVAEHTDFVLLGRQLTSCESLETLLGTLG